METTIVNYTLPAVCHVVCTLLATGIAGINTTDSVPAVKQHPTFPDGYVAYPDVGFAYKLHDVQVTAMEARRGCAEEGAQLALIDSAKKVEYVKRQKQSRNYAHVGIMRMYDDTTWTATSTGLPVSSLPWRSGNPIADVSCKCVEIYFPENAFINHPCFDHANYICELPILQKDTLNAN